MTRRPFIETYRDSQGRTITLCSCGHREERLFADPMECPACGEQWEAVDD